MNHPTSDLQHVAQCLVLTRAGDQIPAADAERLRQIADHGFSSVADAPVEDSSRITPPGPDGGQI